MTTKHITWREVKSHSVSGGEVLLSVSAQEEENNLKITLQNVQESI